MRSGHRLIQRLYSGPGALGRIAFSCARPSWHGRSDGGCLLGRAEHVPSCVPSRFQQPTTFATVFVLDPA